VGRRHLLIAGLLAVQAATLALVPRGPTSIGSTTPGGAQQEPGAATALNGAGGGSASGAALGPGAALGSASNPSGAGPSTGPSSAAGGSVTGGATDVSHCIGGREFNPAIDYFAPPCTPGLVGGSYPNGGGTYAGVTASTVTIVDYITNYGAEVNAIDQAQGTLETYPEAEQLDGAWENFINSHYVLWGRKVHIVAYQGQCQSVPPDLQCLLPEMDSIVSRYHPYMLFWNTDLCSACYEEIARNRVVAVGGDGFSDALANALAPYYYSAGESATRVETAFAQLWCNQLSSVNVPSRRVAFAGHENPAQDFNGQPRVLGVISTNDPDNENTVTQVLQPELARLCGDGQSINAHHYFYAQDINTAAQQTKAGIDAMDTSHNPATGVLCLCDSVAPAFLYEGESQNNYWPENYVATDQGMDLDTSGQSYEAQGGQPALGCPEPQLGCEYSNAFGLATLDPAEPQANTVGLRVYRAGSGSATLPCDSGNCITPVFASYIWPYWNMMASLIENAGPDLTPARMQAAAPALGQRGGGSTGHMAKGFASGDWYWTQDARLVYWDNNRPSPYNGVDGTYVQIEGGNLNLGQYPFLAGGPPIPSRRN